MIQRHSSSSSMSSLPSLSPLSSLLKKQGMQIRRVDKDSNSNDYIGTSTSSSCSNAAGVAMHKPTDFTALNYFVADLSRLFLSPPIEEGEHQTTNFDCKGVIQKAIDEAEEADAEVQDHHHQRFILVCDNARVFANSRPKQQQQQQQQQQYSLSSNSLNTSSSSTTAMGMGMVSQRSVSFSPLTDRNKKKMNKKQHDRWVSDCSSTITRSYGTSSGGSRSCKSSSRTSISTTSSAGTASTTGSNNTVRIRRNSVDSCLNIPKRSCDDFSSSLSASAASSVGMIRKLRKPDSIEFTQADTAQYINYCQNKSSNSTDTRPGHNQRTLSESSDHNFSWRNIKDNTSNPSPPPLTAEEEESILYAATTSNINGSSNNCNNKYGATTTTTTTTTAGGLNNTDNNCRTRRTCSDRFFLLSPEVFEPSLSEEYYLPISDSRSNSNFRRARSAADSLSKALGAMAPKTLSSSASSRRRRRDNNSNNNNKTSASASTRRGRRNTTNNQNDNISKSDAVQVSLSSSMGSLQPPSQPKLLHREQQQQRRASFDTAPKIAIRVSSIERIQG